MPYPPLTPDTLPQFHEQYLFLFPSEYRIFIFKHIHWKRIIDLQHCILLLPLVTHRTNAICMRCTAAAHSTTYFCSVCTNYFLHFPIHHISNHSVSTSTFCRFHFHCDLQHFTRHLFLERVDIRKRCYHRKTNSLGIARLFTPYLSAALAVTKTWSGVLFAVGGQGRFE